MILICFYWEHHTLLFTGLFLKRLELHQTYPWSSNSSSVFFPRIGYRDLGRISDMEYQNAFKYWKESKCALDTTNLDGAMYRSDERQPDALSSSIFSLFAERQSGGTLVFLWELTCEWECWYKCVRYLDWADPLITSHRGNPNNIFNH